MLSSVMLVTNEYPPDRIAGTAMSTQSLAEELASRGYGVSVIVNSRWTAPTRESKGNLTVVRLRPLPLPTTRMAQRAGLLWSIARRIRPDIIQGQSLSCGFLALLVGRSLGIPTVTYVQGLDLCEAGKWARKTYIRGALTHSDAVVAVTSDLRSRAFDLSGRWAEIIPHGFRAHDTQGLDRHTARSLLHLPQEVRIILYVGRLIPIKGGPHLIRSMPHVLMRYPAVILVMVGDGEERRSLEEVTRRLHLESRVLFVGARAHEKVIQFMRASDIFVLPSLVESFGIVLVEAMSCGLPIVASNVMGIPSIIEDGTNGFLVPPGDEMMLAERIMRLLADPAEGETIGRRNIQAAASYAMPAIADRFLSLWENLIRLRRKARRPEGGGRVC